MDTNNTQLIRRLKAIAKGEPQTIRSKVAQEALDYGSDIPTFFHDLLSHGCQSGMISSLIYYADTHAFFDTHYDEIEELRNEYEAMTGEPLRIGDNLKNWLAWFAFEETARKIADEFGIGV